jgi:hypothetical protein
VSLWDVPVTTRYAPLLLYASRYCTAPATGCQATSMPLSVPVAVSPVGVASTMLVTAWSAVPADSLPALS